MADTIFDVTMSGQACKQEAQGCLQMYCSALQASYTAECVILVCSCCSIQAARKLVHGPNQLGYNRSKQYQHT